MYEKEKEKRKRKKKAGFIRLFFKKKNESNSTLIIMPLSHLFISKSRKIDFELTILIQDLTNVPLVSGLYYVKWRLKNATHSTGSTVRFV